MIYDLSTSSKWASLSSGTHTVRLKAQAVGYGSSSFSNEVTVTKNGANPYAVSFNSGTLPSDYKFTTLSQFNLPSSTSSNVVSLWNNYNSEYFTDILQSFGIDINQAASATDGTTNKSIYLWEFDKLTTDRSLACFEKNGAYQFETSSDSNVTLGSPQLKNITIDQETEEPDVEIITILVNIITNNVYLLIGESFNKTNGEISTYLPDLGIIFIAYRYYKPVTVYVEGEPPTYKFIKTPDLNSDTFSNANGYVGRNRYGVNYINFISNSKTYDDILLDANSGKIYYSYETSNGTIEDELVYSADSGWVNELYRTVAMIGDDNTYNYFAYQWLFTDKNWIKQGDSVTLINFTINGDAYQAEDGMTWQQWVASSHNTGGYIIYENRLVSTPNGAAGGGRVTTDSAHNNPVSSSDLITATTYYYGAAN